MKQTNYTTHKKMHLDITLFNCFNTSLNSKKNFTRIWSLSTKIMKPKWNQRLGKGSAISKSSKCSCIRIVTRINIKCVVKRRLANFSNLNLNYKRKATMLIYVMVLHRTEFFWAKIRSAWWSFNKVILQNFTNAMNQTPKLKKWNGLWASARINL